VALCQFLPGPASSQVGFSLGLMRAGYLGGLAAWVGFTLPSAIALVLLPFLKLIAHQLIETRQRLELMKIRSAKERILLYN